MVEDDDCDCCKFPYDCNDGVCCRESTHTASQVTDVSETKDWLIVEFQEDPFFCRVPLYIGGDKQVHIMQPFEREAHVDAQMPTTNDEWVKLIPRYGQVVVSFECLDALIDALKAFRERRSK